MNDQSRLRFSGFTKLIEPSYRVIIILQFYTNNTMLVMLASLTLQNSYKKLNYLIPKSQWANHKVDYRGYDLHIPIRSRIVNIVNINRLLELCSVWKLCIWKSNCLVKIRVKPRWEFWNQEMIIHNQIQAYSTLLKFIAQFVHSIPLVHNSL